MSDQVFGFVLVGIGIVFVLAIVFVVSSRMGSGSGARQPQEPPRGVHMPAPSWLPVAISIAVVLIGASLGFRGDYVPANPWIGIPGVLLFVGVVVAWVRSAGHEWRDVEHRPHDEATGH